MDSEKTKNPEQSAGLFDWVQSVVLALTIGILLFVFLGRIVTVEGSSMNPTLLNSDKLLISRLFYTPERGDIVVIQKNSFGVKPIIKRIIATAGQTVDIDFDEGIVYVDGVAQEESYTAAPTYQRLQFVGPVTVPEGCVFVMGDNRNASSDSRDSRLGMIDTRNIVGRVIVMLVPAKTDAGREWGRGKTLNG